MKVNLMATLVLCLSPHLLWAENTPLKSDQARLSYSLGVNLGEHFRDQAIDIDPEIFARGVRDAILDQAKSLTMPQMQEVLGRFEQSQLSKSQNQTKKLAEENLKTARAYLEKNKKQAAVISTPSGLQYRELTPGRGTSPGPNDMVTVHYRGTLINGSEFDSSYTRGTPANFAVNAVIPGWTEALKLMKPGAKWELFIPPELAYGELGAGRLIGPNAALIFEVELLSVRAKEAEEILDIEPMEDEEG